MTFREPVDKTQLLQSSSRAQQDLRRTFPHHERMHSTPWMWMKACEQHIAGTGTRLTLVLMTADTWGLLHASPWARIKADYRPVIFGL